MDYGTFKGSLIEGLEFKKAMVTSKILQIDDTGIRYSIGKNGNSKKVTFKELQESFNQIETNGCLTRSWYNSAFPIQAKAAGCNFTTIGGLLQHFANVSYSRGVYTKVK